MAIAITEDGIGVLEDHERLSIAFEIQSRLCLDSLKAGRFVEICVERRLKDYDALERVSDFARQFDTTNWRVIGAFEGSARVGGVLLAWNTPGLDMLEGRSDLGVMLDVRVSPQHRGRGIGRLIVERAMALSTRQNCSELRVETQDVNVGACRFYSAMGFRLLSVDEQGYGPEVSEAKLIWSRKLTEAVS